jgi:hypothetical protein
MSNEQTLKPLSPEDLNHVRGGSPTLPLPPPSMFQKIDEENKDGKTMSCQPAPRGQ